MDWKAIPNYVLLLGLFVAMVTMFNQVNGRIDAMQIENNRRFDNVNRRFDAMQTEMDPAVRRDEPAVRPGVGGAALIRGPDHTPRGKGRSRVREPRITSGRLPSGNRPGCGACLPGGRPCRWEREVAGTVGLQVEDSLFLTRPGVGGMSVAWMMCSSCSLRKAWSGWATSSCSRDGRQT